MSIRTEVIAVSAALLLGASAGRAAERAASRYRVSVDLSSSIQALGRDNSAAYDAAVQLLAGLGADVLPILAEALKNEPERARIGVVEVLDQMGEPECVPLLIQAGNDKSVDVRVDAILALGSLADERARPLIEAALDDALEPVRRAAAVACATICRGEAAWSRLARMAVSDQPLDMLFAARRSLGILMSDEDAARAAGARRAMEAVARPAFQKQDARQERVRAALLLADIGDAAAIAALRDSLPAETDPALRNQLIATLGDSGDESAVPVLTDQAKDPARRPVACRALDQLANRRIKGAAEAAAACRAALPARKR